MSLFDFTFSKKSSNRSFLMIFEQWKTLWGRNWNGSSPKCFWTLMGIREISWILTSIFLMHKCLILDPMSWWKSDISRLSYNLKYISTLKINFKTTSSSLSYVIADGFLWLSRLSNVCLIDLNKFGLLSFCYWANKCLNDQL